MGLFGSRQARVLEQGKRIRQDLHNRCQTFLKKYQEQIDRIPTQKKNKIIRSTATQLVDLMDKRQITSEETIFCFSERVVLYALKFHCILDEMLEEALLEGRKCDEQRRKYPDRVSWKRGKDKNQCFPPFFGVPISVKQTVQMKGKRIYFGVITNFQPIPEDDYLFMQLTRKMGFIPFVRSSTPQGCKTIETNNNIVGYAKNPWNLERSTGGSSGGEGGLIASLCSPIGIGTDLGGSLRIPSGWNGICTIKPNGRISRLGDGYSGKLSNGMTVKSTIGFMTKSIQDSIATLAFMCDQQNYKTINPIYLDQYLTLRPFNYKFIDEKPKFRIGVTKHLQTLKCSKTYERVVDECSKILEDDGHTLVPITLKGFEKSFLLLMRQMFCDGGSGILDEIRGDQPLTPEFEGLNQMRRMPQFWKRYLISSLKKTKPRQSALLDACKNMTSVETFNQIYDVQTTVANDMYKIFVENNLDVVIMPGFAIPAVRSGQVPRVTYTYAYTTGWNPICYPAGVVPVTVVKQGQTQYEDDYNDSSTQAIKDNLKGSEGMPAAIQVASTPYNEQKVLYILNEIEKKVKFRQKHPYPEKWD